MTKQTLLKTLRGLGYADDKPTLDSVKAFVESEAIELQDENGNSIDVSKSWNEKTVVTAEAPVETARKMTKTEAKGAGARTASVTEGGSQPQPFSVGNVAKSMFKAKAARGETFIKDVDAAEILGSISRINAMKAMQVDSWDAKSHDLDVVKAINTYDNASGGYLVPPPELMTELIYNGEPTGTARKIANVVNMGRSQTSAARQTADITLPALAEGGPLTSITPATDQVELTPRKCGGYVEVTSEALEDTAFNLGDWVARMASVALDNRIDDSYFLGDGTATYNNFVGLKNSAKVTSVNASGSAWTNIVYADVMKALGTLQGVSGNNIGIVCSRQFGLQVLATLNIATSQFKNVFELSRDWSGGMFLGIPVYFNQRLPIVSASTTKSMYMGDFRAGSMVGMRRDLRIVPDPSAGFSTDGVRFGITARYAVNVHGHGRTDLTNQNIVALATT